MPRSRGYRGSYSVESYLPQITNGPNYPTWSPDGTQIAFAMRGSIWRIKRGDTTAVELTHGEGYDSQPAWSPDGKWVAYTSERNEQIHLKLLNLEDGSIGDLTSGASINVEPEWSPDGKRLAYVSTAPDGRYHVYLMPVENGGGRSGCRAHARFQTRASDALLRRVGGAHSPHLDTRWLGTHLGLEPRQ